MTATDADALLRTIRANPEDDAPRLVYADWLDENGESERAEFIRVQCELARRDDSGDTGEVDPNEGHTCFEDPCQVCKVAAEYAKLSDRAGRLFMAHGREWFGFPRGGGHIAAITDTRWVDVGQTWAVRRGFVAEVRAPLTTLIGGECGRCLGQRIVDVPRPANVRAGGQMNMSEDCPACRGTGRTPGLRDLVRREPVEEVRVTDKTPWSDVPDGGADYGWWEETPHRITQDGPSDPGNIPPVIFARLWDANRSNRREDETCRWVWWDESGIAEDELERAVLAHLRADG